MAAFENQYTGSICLTIWRGSGIWNISHSVDKCTCEIMRDEKYIRQFFTSLSLTKSHEFFRVNWRGMLWFSWKREQNPFYSLPKCIGCYGQKYQVGKKQELIRNITRNIGKKEKRVECGHNEKEALSRPITRSGTASRPKSVTIIAEKSSLKLRNCEKCDWGPLDFSHVADEIQRDPVYLHVLCKKCGHHNVINLQGENDNDNVGARPGSHKNMLARRAALGCLHQGLGHSQYEGLMEAMNIKPVSENTMKQTWKRSGNFNRRNSKRKHWKMEERGKT